MERSFVLSAPVAMISVAITSLIEWYGLPDTSALISVTIASLVEWYDLPDTNAMVPSV
jgi:hypothetical protein